MPAPRFQITAPDLDLDVVRAAVAATGGRILGEAPRAVAFTLGAPGEDPLFTAQKLVGDAYRHAMQRRGSLSGCEVESLRRGNGLLSSVR